MFTNLTPCYEFTDGAGFVVDDWKNIEEGTKVRVYVPSMMSEIEKSEKSAEGIESLSSPYQLFLNPGNCPNIPPTVTTLNYVTAEIVYEMVMNKANEELYNTYKKDPENAHYITHIPMTSKLNAGDQVTISSDIGAIKDLYIC